MATRIYPSSPRVSNQTIFSPPPAHRARSAGSPSSTDLGPDRAGIACLIALAPPEPSVSRRGGIIAPAYSHSETAIWSYDLVSQALTAQWTNSDGSTPQTLIYYDASAPLFFLSRQTGLDGPNQLVTFKCL
ncbi:hypothetical protein B0H14DRAFT_3438683 [Mycena olivaceomarginata]|nr:hypothetical protein B0H14DRAFT_3438683 [Mycena olivaceomarginata]